MDKRKIYCINLKERPERWKKVQKEVEKMGDSYELIRFDAIKNTENPRVGAANSFISIIEQAKWDNKEDVLIIEDDLILHSKSKEIFESTYKTLPTDWDVFLGGVYYYKTKTNINKKLVKVGDFCSLHFALFRNTSYDKIISYKTNKANTRTHIDRYMGLMSANKDLNVYVAWPMFAKQEAGYSDLKKKNVNYNTQEWYSKKGLVFL